MADYSIDDILAELDAKKARKEGKDIPPPPPEKSFDAAGTDKDAPKSEKKSELSATAIIEGINTSGRQSDISATAILDSLGEKHDDGANGARAASDTEKKEKKEKRALTGHTEKIKKPSADKASAFAPPEKAKPKREKEEKRQDSVKPQQPPQDKEENDVAAHGGYVANDAQIVALADEIYAQADNYTIEEDGEDEQEAPQTIPAQFVSVSDAGAAESKEIDEEAERIKREKEEEQRLLILKTERENTNPDDMLDLINPMEVKEKATSQAKASDSVTISELSGMYAGNTLGIAGEQLKAIPPTKSEIGEKVNDARDYLHSDIKEYSGRHTTDTLIERLNKSLEQKRREAIKTHRTITLSTRKGKAPTLAHPLNIDYKKQIIEASGPLPEENPVVEQERQNELSAEKKRKIKDFVIDDNDGADDEEYETEDIVEEFDDYDSSGLIWADLCASHKGLKIRITLLTVITAVCCFVSLMNDFSLFETLGLGETLGFINRLGDSAALVYVYLICGLLGYTVCITVIRNGLIKLFTGRADCDSVCAVGAVLTLIGAVIALIDMQSFKLAHMFVYISTSLVALMFNTIGKMFMITRTKRNFKFVSGDSTKYYADLVENEASVSALTRAATERLPIIAVMRKTEFLTDFLKSSYCDDAADRIAAKLAPISVGIGLLAGILAAINPFGSTLPNYINNENPVFWGISSALAVIAAAAPFSMLLVVNYPLNMASKTLGESNAAILGYDAAEHFGGVNTVMLDAKTLFPAGSVVMNKVKRCQKKKSVIKISVEEAILTAASIAIHTDGIMSYLFYDVTLGNKELLQKVENCIYEDNCGITGWIGTKRVMLGGRALMEMHHIDMPSQKNEVKYCGNEFHPVYLAISGEVVAMFVINMTANTGIKSDLQRLQQMGVTLLVRTTDSLVTADRLSELFELDPDLIRILPHNAHEEYDACTKYTSRGCGELSCNGTLSSFAKAIITAKNLVKDFAFSKYFMLGASGFGTFITLIMIMFRQTAFITPTAITLYNTATAAALMIVQKMRRR